MSATLAQIAAPITVRRHVAALLRMAVPLALAQLAQMAMGLTDTLLLGRLGQSALAAGGLAAGIFFTAVLILQSGLSALAVLVAQARGADRPADIPALYGTALALGVAMSLPVWLVLGQAEAALRWLGEPAALAHDVGRYLDVLRWASPALLAGLGIQRVFLPAIGAAGLLLRVMPAIAVVNLALNAVLIFGLHGHGVAIIGLGLTGSAYATAITLYAGTLVLLACLHGSRRLRSFVTGARFERMLVGPLLRLGGPIAATAAAEMLLFLITGLRAGLFSSAALAAHQIVLSIASVCFMLPLGLSQAANVRTGFWKGANNPREQRRAGQVAILLALCIMAMLGVLLASFARPIVGVYVNAANPANADTVRIAAGLIAIAALFQIADGIQVTALGALRGLGDATVPMVIAAVGYWLIGYPLGGLLAFREHMGVTGLWVGLAAALASVALAATLRFWWITSPRHHIVAV